MSEITTSVIMTVMEGPLSKWTNVVKGWQFRWFVLDDNAGLLSYYTSKEKMKRGSRRGCVRLRGAIIGIDDEDDSTFTITVDHKTFHFQARDADERERWIEMLENTIVRHSRVSKRHGPREAPSIAEFDHKLAETDAYLQILIEQVQSLQVKIDACEDVASKEKYSVIKVTAEAMVEAIKHSIVMLQISKETLKEPVMNGSLHEAVLTTEADFDHFGTSPELTKNVAHPPSLELGATDRTVNGVLTESQSEAAIVDLNAAVSEEVTDESPEEPSLTSNSLLMPTTSYSSSEDEDFYDAEEDQRSPHTSPDKKLRSSAPSKKDKENEVAVESSVETPVSAGPDVKPTIIEDDVYFDELYDEQDDEDLGSLEKHGSIITHLLSQVRIGMDLTKVVLPTFILERRSLLEMYADFFAHPDLFVKIADLESPRDRIVQVVRWYLSMFHAGRNADVAKKAYNPILGETFSCHYSVPGADKTVVAEAVEDGPVPVATTEHLAFIAEQVSHHPPISAFYAEHYNKRISLDGYIWTKSKFLGLSIGVHLIGQAVISVIDKDEEYVLTFPNGYGRSILTVPWVEIGGKVTVSCAKTGYNANVEFHTKPFYGGKKHRISGSIYSPGEKKPFCTLEGEWNGTMWAKYDTGMNECFIDTKKIPIVKKRVSPIEVQGEFESRRLWKEVTYNLKYKNIDQATEHKHRLEQRQRDEAKDRKERGVKWDNRYFHEEGEHWVYDRPLLKRLGKSSTPPGTL